VRVASVVKEATVEKNVYGGLSRCEWTERYYAGTLPTSTLPTNNNDKSLVSSSPVSNGSERKSESDGVISRRYSICKYIINELQLLLIHTLLKLILLIYRRAVVKKE
jgi:hypothetical protein